MKSIKYVFAVSFVLFAVGCGRGRPGLENESCGRDADCAQGLICIHYAKNSSEARDICRIPCVQSDNTCPEGRSCLCPDSPLGAKRCVTDSGENTHVCL
jgi:hypothetical protein